MSFDGLLNQLCDIARKTTVKNEYKQTVTTWTTLYTSIRCRIDPMFVTSSYISQTPNGQITGNDYVGFFNPDTDIQAGDRITWYGTILFARPINRAFGNASLHHLEVAFGLQES